jgi:two-component system, cell cycle sensor histidine kinase and response regulator CckA
LKILAIDDKPDNLTAIKAVLSDVFPGVRVLTALNGHGGIELALAEDPDVVLLDIIMPGMDGFEVCRKLKDDESLKHIPVVFLTALKTDRDSRIKALEAGAEAFLSKPLDEAELTAQIRAMSKIKRAGILQRQENERLTLLVSERTRELEQELAWRKRTEAEKSQLEAQFHQAQKMESVGRLAGGVAHDLNNLLSPILGYGEMLLDEFIDGDDRKESVAQIVNAGERARDLVRQLLAFSRKQVLELKSVDLNNVVRGFEKLLRRTIREDVVIKYTPAASVPHILGDVSQLEQVIMNLMVNAQDAMPDGGVLTIETAVAHLEAGYTAAFHNVAPGRFVMLAVSDTGHGMDTETQAQIFEPFFTTKEMGKGTGLGLSTVYGIVRQHGGSIRVYSEPGQGTSFKIYLPALETTGFLSETSPAIPAKNLCGDETLLLVEDSIMVRDMAETLLKRQGYTVLVAENGTRALSVLENHDGPVHLLLTDVVMPGMNGKDLFDLAASKYPNLKVLYMSGYMDNEIVRCGVLDESVRFIHKPFSVQALASKVREALHCGS